MLSLCGFWDLVLTHPLLQPPNSYLGTIGFYQAEAGTTIAAGKAYIEYGGAAVKAFNLGDATGINLTPALSQGEGASAIYDLSGRRVETVKKGVFVVNGKKVLR